MAAILLLLVLWGFAPTLFLRGWITPQPPSYLDGTGRAGRLLFFLHGCAFTAWMALLALQTVLVDLRRMRLHKAAGRYGYWLIGACSLTGLGVGSYAALHGFHGPGDPISFAAASYAAVAAFAVMAWMALDERRDVQRHKRLVLLATMAAASAGTSRIPLIADRFPAWMDATALLLIPLLVWDLVTLRRIKPVTIWGGGVILFVSFCAVPLGGTAAWHALMRPLLALAR